MDEKEKECSTCKQIVEKLTADGICFACLSKKFEEHDDDEGTWFNKA